jgi:hypothetical protein
VDDVFLGGVAEGVGEFEEFRGDPMGHGGDPFKRWRGIVTGRGGRGMG